MAKLSCNAVNCVHNASGLCGARDINIAGAMAHTSTSTECSTFEEMGLKSSLTNVTNMNIPGQFKQLFNSGEVEMSPSIRCEAGNCLYNTNMTCSASDVHVSGPGALSSSRTCCDTFIEA